MRYLKLLSEININEDDITRVPKGDPQAGLNDLMGWIFILVVFIATVVIILAGISFITSRGDPQKTTNARNAIIYAFIGIIVAALATSIIRFIAESVS